MKLSDGKSQSSDTITKNKKLELFQLFLTEKEYNISMIEGNYQ